MQKAKKEYNYIIFDTPPIAIVTDALLLAGYADINLFIVRQRYTSRNTIDMIEQLYNHGELKNMAIIINDISLSGYYGYGLRYGYMRGYGYTYGTLITEVIIMESTVSRARRTDIILRAKVEVKA